MKFDNTLMKLVQEDLASNNIPMLLGEPGIGKSSWLEALAKINHTKCFTLACNQLADKADLTGARLVPVVDASGNTTSYKQVFYPHAVVHDAIEYAKEHPREKPILFLDELNRTTPDVTSEALSIPTMRSIGSVTLPDNLRVVIAGNDKGNITSLDTASISRFVLYHVVPDAATFLGLDATINPFVKRVIETHPECIFCKENNTTTQTEDANKDEEYIDDILDDGEGMSQITTPRTISATSRWLNRFDNNDLMAMLADTHIVNDEEVSVLQEALEGHIGSTAFCSYLLAEIASGVMTVSNQANNIIVGKPACYDDMKNCTNMTDLQNFIATMSDNDKSGCILYAIYEPEDNATYINALVQTVNRLTSNDMRTLMALVNADNLDKENVQTLLSSKSPLSDTLSIILEV